MVATSAMAPFPVQNTRVIKSAKHDEQVGLNATLLKCMHSYTASEYKCELMSHFAEMIKMTLNSEPENLFSSVHSHSHPSHDEYLCQVSLKCLY